MYFQILLKIPLSNPNLKLEAGVPSDAVHKGQPLRHKMGQGLTLKWQRANTGTNTGTGIKHMGLKHVLFVIIYILFIVIEQTFMEHIFDENHFSEF